MAEKEINKPSLIARWKNKNKKPKVSNPIKKAPSGIDIPLSYGQKRLWFLDQLYPKNPFYNLSVYLNFNGHINYQILTQSLNIIFEKYDILKSFYKIKKGKPTLQIDKKISLKIKHQDFSNVSIQEAKIHAEAFIKLEANTPFNLEIAPLITINLVKIDSLNHILFFNMHHIIADQWSMSNLKKELASHYTALSNGKKIEVEINEINYTDYTYWQNNVQNIDGQIDYWKNKLNGKLPILNLPTDFKRPINQSFKGNSNTLELPKALSSEILEFAKKIEITPFVLFLSAYYLLLYNFSQQKDIIIGTPSSNRDNNNLDKVFGLLIDTLVLRMSVNKSVTILQFINEVKTMFSEALSNKDVPFDYLVKTLNIERSLSTNPLFQAMLVYNSKTKEPPFGADLKLVESSEYRAEVSKFDLTLFITEENDKISSTFEYATDLFEKDSIIRFQNYLLNTLNYILKNVNNSVENIPRLTSHDNKLLEKNNSIKINTFESYNSIHSIIENIAKNNPDAIAVTFQKESISYNTLNKKANQVAYFLLENINESKIVALCIERSIDMLIGLLGILKSGCAYLPIDPDYPKERIDFILKDANVSHIITQSHLKKSFESKKLNTISIDLLDYNINSKSTELPETKNTDLAYVIYTSGSSGKPKGVPISHKNIINSTAGRLNFYDNNPRAFLLMSSMSFDSSKAGIFWTLCTGGNLVITEKRIEQDIEKIATVIKQNTITHTLMLPSLYKVILENIERENIESLNTVIVAGEACSNSLCKLHFKILPNVLLHNEYGPTEASVWCIAHKIKLEDLNKQIIPIGKPVANSKIFILDNQRNQMPYGVSGEIYIGGEGIFNGYLNRPDLTQQAFIDSPFNPNQKLYKTGDLARFLNDGSLQFLGRKDQQIKIRGYRVELNAIENTIIKNNQIYKVIVLAKQKEGTTKRLVAYIKTQHTFDEKSLRLNLKKELPDYMIPSSFIIINEVPKLPNGKIDKNKLYDLEVSIQEHNKETIKLPENKIELQLLNIWKEALNIENLSTKDNFFEVGGDSILSIQIIAKARKLDIIILPNQIFEHQTISELSMFVSNKKEENDNNINLISGKIPLLPIQKWFFDTHKNAPEYWNQAFIIKQIPNTTSEEFVKSITNHIIKNHDALRSSFILNDNEYEANIIKHETVNSFITINISEDLPSNYNFKIEESIKEIQEQTKLEKGELFKCIYFKTGNENNNIIVLLAHHLIIDFISWQIILDTYTQALESGSITKPYKTNSIKTWGDYLQNSISSKLFNDEIQYWKNQVENKINLPNDFEYTLPVFEKDVNNINFKVEKQLTEQLISDANKAYNTKIDELLLTALSLTISNWTSHNTVTLALERHGRETSNTILDLSNTVGWFTAFFPKKIEINNSNDMGSNIMLVKEQMRDIPNGGIGYGVLRYLTENLNNAKYPDIVFNYLGRPSNTSNNVEFLTKNLRHPLSERGYLLEFNALIKDDILDINLSYASKAINLETVEVLIHNFKETLKDIITHCINVENTKYTPSDFQDIDLDQDDLDTLLNDLDL